MPRLLAIANGFRAPARFEPADWAIEDPGTSGQLNLVLNAIPAQGTWPRGRIVYQAGSPTAPWNNPTETIVDAPTLAGILDGSTVLPVSVPFPYPVPNDIDVGVVLRMIDVEGNESGLSEIRIGRATDALSGASAATRITLTTTTVTEDAGIGAEIALISSDGAPTPVYSEVSDPDGKFRVDGNRLLLDGALDRTAAASHALTLRATNAAGSYDEAFTVQVAASGTGQTGGGTAIYEAEIGPAAQVANVQPYAAPANPDRTLGSIGASALRTAIESAAPGEVIRIAAGNWGDLGTVTTSNSGPQIRVMSETYLGAKVANFYPRTSGVAFEGIEFDTLENRGNGSVCRNLSLRNVKTRTCYLQGWENLELRNFIFDNGYESKAMIKEGRGLVARNSIFARGGNGDLIQMKYVHDVDFERCIFFDNRQERTWVNDDGKKPDHADMIQIFWPTGTGFRWNRCLFFQEAGPWYNCQGLFLADAIRSGDDILSSNGGSLPRIGFAGIDVQQCLVGENNAADTAGPNGVNNIFGLRFQFDDVAPNLVANNSVWRVIADMGDQKGPRDNSTTTVRDNITGQVKKFATGSGSAYASETGNVEYGQGNESTYFQQKPHGHNGGWDWRDFRPGAAGKGADAFLAELEAEWGASYSYG